jgi:hypothetical protein
VLGVRLSVDEETSESKRSEKKVVKHDEVEPEEEKGLPWFLIGSIVVLVIVVGIAGFMAYKFWKRRQQEMEQAVP